MLTLPRVGDCTTCQQEVELNSSSGFVNHTNQTGEHCRNSGYSSFGIRYRVDTIEQATALAEAIIADNTVCMRGGRLHSLACGDGDHCETERNRRAKALAEYFLRPSQ